MSTATRWRDEHFVAGDVALDFANTVYRRTPALGDDLLDTTDALTAWLTRAGLLTTTDAPRGGVIDSDAALLEARALRALFWATFDAQKDGRDLPADALVSLFDIARRGMGSDVAVSSDGATTPLTPRGVFAVLALRGIKLALSPPPQGVRACDGCGWFFIDASRSRRRRWCSMKTCGNQAKAVRYRSAHA